MSVIAHIARAVSQLTDRRFLGVLLRALALTIAGLVAIFVAVMWGLGAVLPDSVSLPWVGEVSFVDDVVSLAALGTLLVASVFLMVPAAAAVVGLFLDDVVDAVEERHYPHLPPARASGIAEQVAQSLGFFALVVLADILAFALYLMLPPLAPFIFWAMNGFLLGREYFTLVAIRRLGQGEAKAMRRKHSARLWLVGTLMAVPLSIPLVNLLVPLLGVAVFTHQYHRLASKRARV